MFFDMARQGTQLCVGLVASTLKGLVTSLFGMPLELIAIAEESKAVLRRARMGLG